MNMAGFRTDQGSSVSLAQSHAYCEYLTRTKARNFYYGLKLLPDEKRAAMFAIYAYMDWSMTLPTKRMAARSNDGWKTWMPGVFEPRGIRGSRCRRRTGIMAGIRRRLSPLPAPTQDFR